MSKSSKAKELRQKKRKKKEHKEDIFFKITGVNSNTNAFYALQGNVDFVQILDKADKAFIKSQNKETRDRALDYLVRKLVTTKN